jgi:CheY-like chemotaxis protein
VEETKKLGARALAIEDEDYNRLVLGGILTKLGYDVDWAADGKTAMQLAEQNGYDLILTDWMLPDTDGGTLTKQILAICEEPKPPVFAITAYSTKEKQEECLRAGMAGFISKPITLEKLDAALKGWGADRVSRLSFDREAPTAAVSLEQLGRLGPLEFILPDFTKKLQSDWVLISQLITANPVQAANAAHKLVSATLLIEAQNLSEQLRLFEDLLRKPGTPAEIEKLREICAEEVEAVVRSLRSALKRRQLRLSEAQRPS